MSTCVRCKKPYGWSVVAFIREGLEFKPTSYHFCLECGGNGNNVLTKEELLTVQKDEA